MLSRKLLALVPFAAIGAVLVVHRPTPGPAADGTTILPSGWRIRPLGRQVPLGTLPLRAVVLADGSVMVTEDGYGANGLRHLAADGRLLDTLHLRAAWLGLAHRGRPAADTVWASGGASNLLFRIVYGAGARVVDSVRLGRPDDRVFVAGVTPVPGRDLVAAVGNLSDSVYLVDTRSLAPRAAYPVGHHPYGVVADHDHLYVSDWGDSSVSVIPLDGVGAITRITVGPHPSALALAGTTLYATLAEANAVVAVDLAARRVTDELTIALAPHAPAGTDPNALALAPDARTLYVALAGNNAVAVVTLAGGTPRVAGLLPAGWYPTGVAVAGDGRTLYVVNGKGSGSAANANGAYIGNVIHGTLSIVTVPAGPALVRATRAVYALSPYSNPALRGPAARPGARRPPVTHVVYVIRENRTYDQVLGDDRRGDGDAKLAIFNDSVTPNAHAIADRWVLFDNFYVDGEVSADGHEWTDRAFAGEYNEKTWPQVYSGRREWDLTSGEDLADPQGAYLWDAAERAGRWLVDFGERVEGDRPTDSIWTNTAALKAVMARGYPGFVLAVPDTVRAAMFADSVASWDRQGRFPDLVILYLPRDHTEGRRGNGPTPRAMVAENDLALGRVVARLSRSPAWRDMAVFVLEDDAQDGPDHVDAHRSVLLLASPWARRGVVDSSFYTTSSVLRTIGALLGLPPLSQYDAAATPLFAAFGSTSDLSPYAERRPLWPLDERNPTAIRSRIPWSDFTEPDAADERVLNAEIWHSVHPDTPLPASRHAFVAGRPGAPDD